MIEQSSSTSPSLQPLHTDTTNNNHSVQYSPRSELDITDYGNDTLSISIPGTHHTTTNTIPNNNQQPAHYSNNDLGDNEQTIIHTVSVDDELLSDSNDDTELIELLRSDSIQQHSNNHDNTDYTTNNQFTVIEIESLSASHRNNSNISQLVNHQLIDNNTQTMEQNSGYAITVTDTIHEYIQPDNNNNYYTWPCSKIDIIDTLYVPIDDFRNKQLRNDTLTPRHVAAGIDSQGIPWSQLNLSRHEYRTRRNEFYSSDSGLAEPNSDIKLYSQKSSNKLLYQFHSNYLSVKPYYFHFQLRHLVCATSAHDIYTMCLNNTSHYNTITNKLTSCLEFTHMDVMCSLQVDSYNQLLFLGGTKGEFICMNLITGTRVNSFDKITSQESSICNSITLYNNNTLDTHILISDNDTYLRDIAVNTMQCSGEYKFDIPINYSCSNPDNNNMICVVGDTESCYVIDRRIESSHCIINELIGHTDHSFSSSWNINGINICTASQDCTGRIWDIRNTKQSTNIISANMSPIRSCMYSHDGTQLVLCEAADYIHIYQHNQQYTVKQTIDLFGEISGISYSPDDESIFIGVTDRIYGCLLQYNKCKYRLNDLFDTSTI